MRERREEDEERAHVFDQLETTAESAHLFGAEAYRTVYLDPPPYEALVPWTLPSGVVTRLAVARGRRIGLAETRDAARRERQSPKEEEEEEKSMASREDCCG